MFSYKVFFALLVVIGMANALPIGGGGSGLPNLSEILAVLHKIQDALAELQNSVPGAPTPPSLPGLTFPTIPAFTFPTRPPVYFTRAYTLPPVPSL